MTGNTKQQQLTLEKGITHTPSDIICSDQALEVCDGMIYDNGEFRPLQNPKPVFTTRIEGSGNITPLYLHRYNDHVRVVAHKVVGNGTYNLVWGVVENEAFSERGDTLLTDIGPYLGEKYVKVQSIGKTLIVSTPDAGLSYFLWKGNEYKPLGNNLPDPEVEFALHDELERQGVADISHCYNGSGLVQEKYNTAVLGIYAEVKNKIAEQKGFCLPFFIRYALKMYDGSYTKISQPILLYPCVTNNAYAWIGEVDSHKELYAMVHYCTLRYWTKNNLSDYSDIVKGISIFVTEGVEINDLLSDPAIDDYIPEGDVLVDSISSEHTFSFDFIYLETSMKYRTETASSANFYRRLLKKRSNIMETLSLLSGQSIFYKLCDIGLAGQQGYMTLSSFIDKLSLMNLTTQEQLQHDDYFGHANMFPQTMFTYNSRLNIANVKRSVFEGFGNFMPLDDDNAHYYGFFVTIETDSGTFVVKHVEHTKQLQGFYFYYPSPSAKHVIVFKSEANDFGAGSTHKKVLDANLSEHPGLNGAYYLMIPDVSSDTIAEPNNGEGVVPKYDLNPTEMLPNYVITSEVNNPFVFLSEGYNKVSTGKIIGMSAVTQPLSDGQFGQFPLIVFSESGIWAMTLNDTGLFVKVDPMSREVCVNERSITPTDDLVFFASQKGLMAIAGRRVELVSEQMNGKGSSFIPFVTNPSMFIAYDYRASLLYLCSNSRTYYTYAIKNGTFAKHAFIENFEIVNVLNDYPDNLLVTNIVNRSDGVYSLYEKAEQNSDKAKYHGTIQTRPLKLEDGLAMKSVIQIKNIYQIGDGGSLQLRVYATNDLNKPFVELNSLRGRPWKYYKVRYEFSGLNATDRFAGSVLLTQERRTDKLR